MAGGLSFTQKSNGGLLRVLKTECGVTSAFDPAKTDNHPKPENFLAIWDTGATGTVITKTVVDRLGLKPIGRVKAYHANGEDIVNVYVINLLLPNHVGFSFLRVTEGILNGADMLIGMDVITKGDFSITNVQGNTTFSFRIPSMEEIDYVRGSQASASPEKEVKKVGRNDPCPCGSGKKYKYCHGS